MAFEPGEKTEILEPVHDVVRELIDKEEKIGPDKLVYTDTDIIAVTLLYSMVLGSRFTDKLIEEKAGIILSNDMSTHFARAITEQTRAMSGVDVSRYYKK